MVRLMTATARGTSGAPHSALADTVLERLTVAYAGAADPVRAAGMRSYMKDVSPFLGIPTPERRALSRTVLAGTPRPGEDDLTAVALRCWALPEREYQYFAVDYLRRYTARCSSAFLPVARELIVTRPWWDTVDLLAAHVVGGLVAADPRLTAVMDDWIADDDLWLARTALLHQLRYKDPPTPTGSSPTACASRGTRTSSSARRSAGPCASTPRPIRTRSAPSSPVRATASRRCRSARR